MSKNANVFRAYDIRGISPGELDPAFAERLGRAIVRHFGSKHVMVGRDMRITSPDLEHALIRGITAMGADVTKIGMCSTPMFNVSIGLAGGTYDFGVMVTASHNPAEYNGFKMTDGDVRPIGAGCGMEEIRDLFLSDDDLSDAATMGTVHEDPDARTAYIDHILGIVSPEGLPHLKIAIDAGNGMNGFVLEELRKRLSNIEILPLYWEPDGRFPNHEANPLKKETLHDLQELVRSEACDFGVAFDGDGDRVGFVDELGEPIDGSFLTALFATEMLKSQPGSLILYDLRSSWSTPEEIERAGGKSEMTRVGHAFIKRQMREQGAIFGGEISMHFYFGEIWGVESSDLCLLLMMKMRAEAGVPLSNLWKPMQRYAYSGEINSTVADKDAVIVQIRAQYESQASVVTDIDGIRMEFNLGSNGSKRPDAWWFSLRASNTEPLLRLIVEAVSQDVMEAKRDELLQLIRAR